VSYHWLTVLDISVTVTNSLYSVATSQRVEVESNFGFHVNTAVKFKGSEQVKLNFYTTHTN
jgi:hypothetical protein